MKNVKNVVHLIIQKQCLKYHSATILRCHTTVLRCLATILRCHTTVLRCHTTILRCHATILRCHTTQFCVSTAQSYVATVRVTALHHDNNATATKATAILTAEQ